MQPASQIAFAGTKVTKRTAVLYSKLTLLGIHSQVFSRGNCYSNCHYTVTAVKGVLMEGAEHTFLLVLQGQTFRLILIIPRCDRIDHSLLCQVEYLLSNQSQFWRILQLWMKMLPLPQYAGCVDKRFFQLTI